MKKKFNAMDSIKCYIVAVISYFMISLIFSIIAMEIAKNNGSETLTMPNYLNIIAGIVTELGFISGIFILKKKGKLEALSIKFKNFNFIILFLCLSISVITMLSYLSFNNLFLYFLEKIGYDTSATSDSIKLENFGNLIVSLFALSLVPAICEELLFRGTCFNGFKEKGKLFALLTSSLLFMLIHMGLTQSLYQLILGFIFALVLEITDNLIYTMSMHFLNNSIIIVWSFVTKNNATTEYIYNTPIKILTPFLLLLAGGIVVFFLFKLLNYLVKKFNYKNEDNITCNTEDTPSKNDNMQFAKIFAITMVFNVAVYILMIFANIKK